MKSSYKDNILLNNPVLIGSLGFVSVLSSSVTLKAALLMSLAVFLVLLFSSIVTSLIKKLIPLKYDIIPLMIIIVAFSTIAQMLLEFYYPVSVATMGIGTWLIPVNSIILSRLQNFAIGSSVTSAIADSITNGLGYTLVLVVLGTIRELIGFGSIYGIQIIPQEFTIPTFSGPVIAFILLGILVAFGSWYERKTKLKGLK